ncbi:MAG: serine/threonine-protein kinase [Candidatus Solibacter sp.]|nr:serine/threonine-protein kinase [Candidatus Solibacter sp.]
MSVPISSWIGNYEVVELLGSGGMGEVYLVEERGTRVRRAMKTLRSGSPDSDLWRRFMNEGRVHSALSHPNIASFHEMFLFADRPCLVMEYVDGETLFARIRRLGPLPWDQTLAVLSHLCEALSYLHERGVMHRDLKSANIKITSGGSVKLLDFGIAKLRRSPGMTMAGTVMGTPEYLAPEQIGGQAADARSEIWALGLLGYEMSTGRLPFDGEDELALYNAIRNINPPPPSALNPDVPPPVDSLVMRCLEKRPSRRYQATCEVAAAIRQTASPARGGQRLPAMPTVLLERWRGLSRGVRIAAIATVLLLVIWYVAALPSGSGEFRTITLEVVDGTADVYANGSRVGRTPHKTRARLGESVQFELRKNGYVDQPIQFEVTERKSYSYAMQPAAGR